MSINTTFKTTSKMDDHVESETGEKITEFKHRPDDDDDEDEDEPVKKVHVTGFTRKTENAHLKDAALALIRDNERIVRDIEKKKKRSKKGRSRRRKHVAGVALPTDSSDSQDSSSSSESSDSQCESVDSMLSGPSKKVRMQKKAIKVKRERFESDEEMVTWKKTGKKDKKRRRSKLDEGRRLSEDESAEDFEDDIFGNSRAIEKRKRGDESGASKMLGTHKANKKHKKRRREEAIKKSVKRPFL